MSVAADEVRDQILTPPIYRGEQFVGVGALAAEITFTPGATGLRFAIGPTGSTAETPTVEVTDVSSADGVVEVVNTDEIRVTIEEDATATLLAGRNRWTLYGTVSTQPKVLAAGYVDVRKGAGTLSS